MVLMSGYRKIVAVLLLAQFISWAVMGVGGVSCLCSASEGDKMVHDPPANEGMSCCRNIGIPHSQAGNTGSRAAADENRNVLQEQKFFIVSPAVKMVPLCPPLCVSARTSSQTPLSRAKVEISNFQYLAPVFLNTRPLPRHSITNFEKKTSYILSANHALFLMHSSFLI